MTITPHFLLGASVATTTANPVVAFLLGFLSHFVLDAIPHLDPGTFTYQKDPERKPGWGTDHDQYEKTPLWIFAFIAFEFIAIGLISFFLFKQQVDFEIMMIGGFSAILVDIFDNPIIHFEKLPILKQIHWLHHRTHFDLPKRLWYWGLPVEILVIGGCVWYLLRF